ncbi:cupin domain-containing protein [Paenibacillus rhizovicinus]|uniref:Cupin domain-containing protein n=1 Tax=Paenibacillus rhizovicinus TaxID=2704463 RepID=A0A6C0P1A4_9BACL|nr:cupin domain-containing protein [Paenibacillus rhizovicinus]QHW31683.1 cupin domain-containing protein [Paenibacillus rhizovicinus]
MKKKNFLAEELESLDHCHEGVGTLRHITLYNSSELESKLKFFNYTVLPPGTSIGYHKHAQDEEVYVILEGTGTMTVDGESTPVKKGDVLVNRPWGEHGLVNDSEDDLCILVFEAGC